jgi:hypothetical protein
MHDLIREHARVLAGRIDPDRDQATGRLLDYYQHTAARADAFTSRRPRSTLPTAAGQVPAAAPALASQEQALNWLRAERGSLFACLDHATATSQHARITALTAALAGLLGSDGPWAEAITRHTAAVHAARHLGDRLGQAGALCDLGAVRWLTDDDFSGASQTLMQALAIYLDLGERRGQANASTSSGPCGRIRVITRARAGTWSRRWVSTVTSATGAARPAPSTNSGLSGG